MRLTLDVEGTARAFVQDDSYLRILRGPRGAGKTTTAYIDLLKDAGALPREARPLRVIAVRGTWADLNRTTMENLRELQTAGLPVRWLDQGREAIILDWVHLFFIGMDTFGDLNKFQGFKAGRLWIEEPAPVVDVSGGVAAASAGLPVEVFGVGATSLRQIGVPSRVVITMNPPDEEHWTLKLAERLKDLQRERPEFRDVRMRVFDIAPGENKHITEEQRRGWEAALIMAGRGDVVTRLIHGKVGFVQMGEAVTPEYADELHLAKFPLPIRENLEVQRLWDFGLNPTCVWTQVMPSGTWHILGCRVGDNVGMEQFSQLSVLPWERRFLKDPSAFTFRDIGDPAGMQREQSNSEQSAVTILQEYLGSGFSFEPGPQAWDTRLQAIKGILSQTIRGRGRLQIDPDEGQAVRKALRGGAHYPKDGNGNPIATVGAMKKASGLHSHPFDAVCYGAAVIFGSPAQYRRPVSKRERVPLAGKPGVRWMAG